MANSCARVAGFLVPLAAGELMNVWTPSVIILSGATGIGAAMCHLLNPIETRGMSLT